MFSYGKSNYLIMAVILCMALATALGCGGNGSDSPAAPGPSTPPGGNGAPSGSLTTAGSTSVQPVSELLAEGFMLKYSGTTIYVQGGGSSTGIQAASEGVAEIGASSRDLKPEEKHLVEHVIGIDGIVIVVHPSSPVEDISLEQIKEIYAGNITDWSEVGGPGGSIVVVTREEGSGTRGAFEEIVMGKDLISDRAIVQNSTGAVRTTVASDPNAIGYISLAALNDEVKDIKVDGVPGTKENILSQAYKVARPFIYVTKEEPAGLTKDFLGFVLSPEGQDIVEEAGLVRVK